MRIINEVYGEEEIKEIVLIDLINSKAVQRLKKISQYGPPSEYYHKISYSRYEHSIGVLILLRRLNADLKEQIAGLLHDVSHTAFSHVVDWVIGDPTKEDYQDNFHLEILKDSDIPNILKKYGFEYKEISNIRNFSLLEKGTPSLCADRIDYTLQELQRENPKNVETYLKDLIKYKRQIVFKSKEIAELFAREYARLQREHWAGEQARTRYYLLANILKKALKKNIISLKDFKKTDEEVIDKLQKSSDEEILEKLNLLRAGFKIEPSNNKSSVILRKKVRYIDPEILIDNRITKLSTVSEDYREFTEREKEKQNSNFNQRINIVKLY